MHGARARSFPPASSWGESGPGPRCAPCPPAFLSWVSHGPACRRAERRLNLSTPLPVGHTRELIRQDPSSSGSPWAAEFTSTRPGHLYVVHPSVCLVHPGRPGMGPGEAPSATPPPAGRPGGGRRGGRAARAGQDKRPGEPTCAVGGTRGGAERTGVGCLAACQIEGKSSAPLSR